MQYVTCDHLVALSADTNGTLAFWAWRRCLVTASTWRRLLRRRATSTGLWRAWRRTGLWRAWRHAVNWVAWVGVVTIQLWRASTSVADNGNDSCDADYEQCACADDHEEQDVTGWIVATTSGSVSKGRGLCLIDICSCWRLNDVSCDCCTRRCCAALKHGYW